MNKTEIQKLAQDTFKSNPDAKECFITSDGYVFLSKNAADLHKNTNPKKKKLTVIPMVNEAFGASDAKKGDKKQKDQKSKGKKLSAMNKTELLAVAKLKDIRVDEGATNPEIVKLIEDVINAEIKE
jgi:hypothetical protein